MSYEVNVVDEFKKDVKKLFKKYKSIKGDILRSKNIDILWKS